MQRTPFVGPLVIMLVLATPPLWAGDIEGHAAKIERIKGRPEAGYKEVYETNLWISPPSESFAGPHRRLGITGWNPDGNYCASGLQLGDGSYCAAGLPAGNYSVYVNQPLFFVAPSLVRDVSIPPSGLVHLDVEMGIDFSSYFFDLWAGLSPTWYQTFVATSTGIRGIAFSYRDGSPGAIKATVLQDNGDPDVRNWTPVGQATDDTLKGGDNDNWVRFRYGEVPTIPRRMYAVRLTGGGGFCPYIHVKNPGSYPHGTAWDINGQPQNFDLNVTVFNDREATCVTLNQRVQDLLETLPGFYSASAGQSFTANGTSLAAADIFVAGVPWDIDFAWRVYEASDPTGPRGPQIGPTKITEAGSQAGKVDWATAVHAVSYNPGEVPLVPGRKYFISFTASPGFGPYRNKSPYDGGMSYLWNGSTWDAYPDIDLCMTILEHKSPAPALLCNPLIIRRRVTLGDQTSPVDTFTVANSSAGTLNFSIAGSNDWMSISPTSGTSSGEDRTVSVRYSTASLPVGNYTQVMTVSSPEAYNNPQTVIVHLEVATVRPDFDHDTDVDMSDYAHLQVCYTGLGNPQDALDCQNAKLDNDNDVDLDDFNIFLNCLSGSNTRANPTCSPP